MSREQDGRLYIDSVLGLWRRLSGCIHSCGLLHGMMIHLAQDIDVGEQLILLPRAQHAVKELDALEDVEYSIHTTLGSVRKLFHGHKRVLPLLRPRGQVLGAVSGGWWDGQWVMRPNGRVVGVNGRGWVK